MSTVNCPQCGATNEVSPGQSVVTCSFCRTPLQAPSQQAPIGSTPGMYGQFFGGPGAGSGYGPPPMPPAYGPPPVYVQPVRSGGMGMLWLLLAVPVLLAMLGGIIWFMARAQADSGSSSTGAGGGGIGMGGGTLTGPVVCSGNDEQVLEGYVSETGSGTGIMASGNCTVKCTRCRIRASTGIIATGNAEVILTDSTVEGSAMGIVASGNATVKLLGASTLSGAVTKSGNATVTAPTPAGGPKAHGH